MKGRGVGTIYKSIVKSVIHLNILATFPLPYQPSVAKLLQVVTLAFHQFPTTFPLCLITIPPHPPIRPHPSTNKAFICGFARFQVITLKLISIVL